MRMPHTSAHKGKRVRVILRDGTQIVDRFVERTDRFVVLEEHGRIPKADIRAFSIRVRRPGGT